MIKFLSYFIPFSKSRKTFRNRYLTSIIVNKGKNNKFIILDEFGNKTSLKSIKNLQISFRGDNNTIVVHKNLILKQNFKLSCSSNNCIKLGKNIYISRFNISRLSPNSNLSIGDNCSFIDVLLEMHDEPDLSVSIGDDCLFSHGIVIRPSDGHSILDAGTNKIINYPKPIKIDDKCWVGMKSLILKGSIVPKNSILAAGTVYTDKSNLSETTCCNGAIYAGVPARLIKQNALWDVKNTYELEKYRGNNDKR